MQHRILISNLGYARDIDGALLPHMLRSYRQLRTPLDVQQRSLAAYRQIIAEADPDICCMLEIDTGSFTSGDFDQFAYLADTAYPHCDVSSKYAPEGGLTRFALTRGKSNGFMAKHPYVFERLYFSRGSKRLLYRVVLEPALVLFFTHLSLGRETRTQQLKELRALADKEQCETVIAGDFNIFAGLNELSVFLQDGAYQLLNAPEWGTFTLFGRHYLLDIALISKGAAAHTSLRIIDQPFSDHDALLITVNH